MAEHENDILIIPAEIEAMSIAELREEKAKLLKEMKQNRSPKKTIYPNKSGITVNV